MTRVTDFEACVNVARYPETKKPVVVGPARFVDEDLVVTAGERDLHVRVVELPETGGEIVEVTIVSLIPVGRHRDVHLVCG